MSSMSPTHSDFLPQLKAIGQSLKKRFFRKPNVADAINQYEELCQELRRDGQDEFAAVCALEAAKCQESLQNHMEYGNVLVKAAKYFLDARKAQHCYEVDENVLHISSRGYVQLAMQYLGKASEVYKAQQNYGLALLAKIKMGQTLFEEKEYGESLKCYKNALDLASSHFTLADELVIVEAVIKCKVKTTELESASKIVNEYLSKLRKAEADCPTELYLTFTLRFEVMRVCLLLILDTDSVDFASFISQEPTLSEDDHLLFESEERQRTLIYLKSLVLAVQHGSVDEIIQVRDHLSPLFTEIEHELFFILINIHS